MSTQNTNRVEAELLQWRQQEERFQKAFSLDMSSNKGLRREQLLDYDRIVAKYKNTNDPEERSTLRILRQQRKRIEKQAYPNGLVRLFRKIFVNPVRRFRMARQNKRLEQSNQIAVSGQLNKIGMGEHYPKAEMRMKNGEREFTIPVSNQINERERMDHILSFEMNSAGEYKMVSNKIRLNNESDPKLSRQQTFKLSDGTTVNADESYNLLNGRAVQKDGKWIKLDLNDKDTEGNYRIREFSQSYGYDLEQSLKDLPIKEMQNKAQREKLIADLKKGERSQVTIGNKKYNVEANPQFKSVNIYDANSQKVSIAEAQGKRTIKEHLTQNDSKTKTVKKTGMRIA